MIAFSHRRASVAVATLTLASLLVPAVSNAQRLTLTVNPVTITFVPADPDTVPIVASAPVQITYRVQQNKGPWTLTLVASGDLTLTAP